MKRLGSSTAFALAGLLGARAASAEGTAQLGADQDVREGTVIEVDILSAGEVINITVGNNTPADPTPITVNVRDPSNDEVSGSPFTVGPGDPGWSDQMNVVITSTDTAAPLQVIAAQAGVYSVRFDTPLVGPDGNEVVDPLDITVTPDTSTNVDPAAPPGGYGRVHSTRWLIDAHSFAQSHATNAEFYVLVPITGTRNDYTWLLRFDGLAGYLYEVAGNDVGLPPPHSGFSEDRQIASAPQPQYDIYLNVPEVARGGGDIVPVVSGFEFEGPSSLCTCALAGQESTFRFESDVDGVYEIVIDVDGDDTFDPSSGDVLLKGTAVAGANAVSWDGTQADGSALGGGSYRAELSVRLGEFHFVGSDIETSYPGVRMFGVEPPEPDTVPSPTLMFWDDTRINSTLAAEHNTDPGGLVPAEQRSVPETTKPDGLSSGSYSDPTYCGRDATSVRANAHCWGDFSGGPDGDPLSPGNYRYVDTYTFFEQSEAVEVDICTWDPAADEDEDGVSNLEECTSSSPMDPQDGDTDGDGISDGDELGGNVQTDPTSADSDGDCVPDGVEDADQDGTLDSGEMNPTDSDSDADGIADGVELGSDPDDGCASIPDATGTDPLSDDSDADGIPDGVEDRNLDGQVDAGETNPAAADTDGDGIPDGVEDGNQNGSIDTGETDPRTADTDGDGLSDGIEDADQDGARDLDETDPLAPDTDEDGLDDGLEDRDHDGRVDDGETDPRSADTDDDGLADGVEDADQNGERDAGETDPTLADSDEDGLTDGVEDADQDGTLDDGETDPNDPDSDGDEVYDGVEDSNQNGRRDLGETDPRDADSDDDGLEDGEEDADQDGRIDTGETDPLDLDTDNDRLPDGVELGVTADGSVIEGATLTNPLSADTDRDGLSDGDEDFNRNGVFDVDDSGTETDPTDQDSDDDGLLDSVERGYNVDGSRITNVNLRPTNPLSDDSDGDGIPDGIEDASRDGVFDPGETDPLDTDTDRDDLLDGDEDADHDGIVDSDETDPRDPDTDHGGEPDGSEVNLTHHDPLWPDDDRSPTFALYGGGCSCEAGPAPPAAPAGAASLLLGLLLLMRRRRRRSAGLASETGAGS